jgi:hypothetical protein
METIAFGSLTASLTCLVEGCEDELETSRLSSCFRFEYNET